MHSNWLEDGERPGRRLRITPHAEQRTVVLSFWDESVCTGTFRLGIDDTPALIGSLVDSLHAATYELRDASRPSFWSDVVDRARSWIRNREGGAVVLPSCKR